MTNPEVTQADVALAEDVVSAANIVSHDGYYEVDIYAASRVIARHRATLTKEASAEPAGEVNEHRLDQGGLVCSCHARFSTRWEAAEHAGLPHGGPLAALTPKPAQDVGATFSADKLDDLERHARHPNWSDLIVPADILRLIEAARLAALNPEAPHD